jgi:hypothetical protein
MHNERRYEASWNFYSFERKRKIGLNQQHHLMGSTGDGRCGLIYVVVGAWKPAERTGHYSSREEEDHT